MFNRGFLWLFLSMFALAGCQAPANLNDVAASDNQALTDAIQNPDNGRLRIYLADKNPHAGWHRVELKSSGELYVNTDVLVFNRTGLKSIQSATDNSGQGVLVLHLNSMAQQNLYRITSSNPGMHLALIVDQVMLAAPEFATAIDNKKIAFQVGTARNAELAARTVARQ